jgi:hypothetical protein
MSDNKHGLGTIKREQIMAHKRSSGIRRSSDRRIGEEIVDRTVRLLPAMPIEVIYNAEDKAVSCEKHGDDIVYTFRYSKEPRDFAESKVNAYELRATFLDIKTPGEAFEFLNLTGCFRGPVNQRSREQLTWQDFQNWQEIIRLHLRHGLLPVKEMSRSQTSVFISYDVPDRLRSALSDLSQEERSWLHAFPNQLVIRSARAAKDGKRRVLYAEIMVSTTLQAILATVYVDHLRGINYRLCARSDCSAIYEVSSKHERQYCTQACAHTASVRRRRAGKKVVNTSEV